MSEVVFTLKMAMAFVIGLASMGNPSNQTAYRIHEITLGANAVESALASRTPAGFSINTQYTSVETPERREQGVVVAVKKVESTITESITVVPSANPLRFDILEVGKDDKTLVDLSTLFANMKDVSLTNEGMHVLRLAKPDGKAVEICVARFDNMVVVQQKGSMTAFCIQPVANAPQARPPANAYRDRLQERRHRTQTNAPEQRREELQKRLQQYQIEQIRKGQPPLPQEGVLAPDVQSETGKTNQAPQAVGAPITPQPVR